MARITLPPEDIIVPRPTATSEMLRRIPIPPVTPGLPAGVEEALNRMAAQRLLEEETVR